MIRLVIGLSLIAFGLVGCEVEVEPESRVERVTDAVEESVDDVTDTVENVADDIEEIGEDEPELVP